VICFTYKDLFKTGDRQLSGRMREIWKLSLEVAAIARVLAEMTPGIDPEQAQLAGLLHDIGTLPLLCHIATASDLIEPDRVAEILRQLKGEVGAMTLSKWGLPRELVAVAEHSDDWFYDHDEAADLVDVVLIAKLHALIGKPAGHDLPRMDTVPAFHKLALGGLGPQESLAVLEKAGERIAEARGLLE